MKNAGIVFLLMIAFYEADATDWILSRENDFLKVYTAKVDNSNVKAVKVVCTVSATMSQVLAAFFDIEGQKQWIYGDKKSNILLQPSDSELVYYSEVSVPWPFNNRDFIAHVKATHPSKDKVVIDSYGEPEYVPEKKGIVRVLKSSSHMVLTNAGNNTTLIDYEIQFDPGGTVPSWVTNLFVSKGPYESFERLPKLLKAPDYQKAHFAFLQ